MTDKQRTIEEMRNVVTGTHCAKCENPKIANEKPHEMACCMDCEIEALVEAGYGDIKQLKKIRNKGGYMSKKEIIALAVFWIMWAAFVTMGATYGVMLFISGIL